MTSTKSRAVICIGDIHGNITKLEKLWSNLEKSINPQDLNTALVIFLGDYCDRGSKTKEVIDFLIKLPSLYPDQKHVFLAGNHDFSLAAFLGLVPEPPNGLSFKEGWKEYEMNEEREGWYKGTGYENMHLQGRMWGGCVKDKFDCHGIEFMGSVYDASPTFESYGVPHGSSDLIQAVPDEHKKFLSNMVWVHEEEDVCIETKQGIAQCKLIAVHAGLEKDKSIDEQLQLLRAKDTSLPVIQGLCGRRNVWDVPEDLIDKSTIVVSGHHGKLHVDGLRLIIDEGGGYEDKPLAAIVLPSMKVVRDTDDY